MIVLGLQASRVNNAPAHSFHPNVSLRMTRQMGYVAGVQESNK